MIVPFKASKPCVVFQDALPNDEGGSRKGDVKYGENVFHLGIVCAF